MDDSAGLIAHYGGAGLLAAIEAGLGELGVTPRAATVDDLAPVDEFHIGGRPATVELARRLEVESGMDVLDVGCGIGGASRFFAAADCQVQGVDLNPTYVEVARVLTEWTGLAGRARFEAGSALRLPFEADSFDRAVQLHVGMNIAAKADLFREIGRVLRAGGRLGVYDIVRQGTAAIRFPMPWASDESQSHLADADAYRTALEAAGFEVDVRDRRQFALDFFAAQDRRAAEAPGPPPLGLHLVMGLGIREKLGNLRRALGEGALAPVEFICTHG